MVGGRWERWLAKEALAEAASARFTATVLGRWRSDEPEWKVRGIFSAAGFHLFRPDDYLPNPNKTDLDAGYHLAGSGLPGLDMSRVEVFWAGNRLLLEYPEKVAETSPELAGMRELYPQSEPTSFRRRVRP